jgi:hypothetical protein
MDTTRCTRSLHWARALLGALLAASATGGAWIPRVAARPPAQVACPDGGAAPAAAHDVLTLAPADLADPAGPSACAARAAFRQGAIVVLRGGPSAQLAAALGIEIAEPSASESRPGGDSVPHALEAVAAHQGAGGGLHLFHGLAARPGQAEGPLQDWMVQQRADADGLGDTPAPPPDAWTELLTDESSSTDSHGNQATLVYGGYRLNDINTEHDWYMVTNRMTSRPGWQQNCDGDFVDCGWRAGPRTIGVRAASPDVTLFDHGPGTTPSTETAELSIGASLSGSGDVSPGVNATYNVYWSQASVSTVDHSTTEQPQPMGSWSTSFEGWRFDSVKVSPPPANSTSTYFDSQGAIFQGPAAAPLLIALTDEATFLYDHEIVCGLFKCGAKSTDSSPINLSTGTPLYPPVFDVTPTTPVILQAPPGEPSTADLQIAAHVDPKSGGQDVAWVIDNVPSWLSMSQTSGAGDATVTLAIEPTRPPTPSGSSAILNIDSDPAAAAPNVKRGPLQVHVCVTTCPAGEQLAGG